MDCVRNRDYADGFAERSGIRTNLNFPDDLQRLPPDVEPDIFRIIQQWPGNIHRYFNSALHHLNSVPYPATTRLD